MPLWYCNRFFIADGLSGRWLRFHSKREATEKPSQAREIKFDELKYVLPPCYGVHGSTSITMQLLTLHRRVEICNDGKALGSNRRLNFFAKDKLQFFSFRAASGKNSMTTYQ